MCHLCYPAHHLGTCYFCDAHYLVAMGPEGARRAYVKGQITDTQLEAVEAIMPVIEALTPEPDVQEALLLREMMDHAK